MRRSVLCWPSATLYPPICSVYLLWHFSALPSDPLQAPLCASGMWIDFSSVQLVEDPISSLKYLHRFPAVFFSLLTNTHFCWYAHIQTVPHANTHTRVCAHTHTGIKANSVLGLLLLPWSCPLPPPSLCLAPILEREDLLWTQCFDMVM